MKRLNRALPNLLLGIIGYGLIAEGIGLWFTGDKIRYSLSLAIGLGCAVFMAIHMAISIEDSVSLRDEKKANNKSVSGSIFRYTVVLVVFVIMLYLKIGDLLPAFVGVMGLKFSAYGQQFFFRTIKNDPSRMVPEEEQYPSAEDEVEAGKEQMQTVEDKAGTGEEQMQTGVIE